LAGLFLGKEAYFWSMCKRGWKSSMQKIMESSRKKNNENQCDVHEDRPGHVRFRVLDMNVKAISQ
jgi:hypothetical protein